MTIDDFLKRVELQPTVNEQRIVNVWGPQLQALVAQRKAMTVAELMAHPDQRKESRTLPRGHVLGPGLPQEAIDSWQKRRPSYVLPRDLTELLSRANGIHLWADLDAKKAYFGILPLEEWLDASQSRLGRMFEEQPRGCLVLSYHDNGDYYLVLDTQKQAYFWFDTQDFNNPVLVAENVNTLLSWWWNQTTELAPEVFNS
jgi:SMI1 / KNR4 family (SUKH-1)